MSISIDFEQIFSGIAVSATLGMTFVALLGALRSGAIRQVRLGSILSIDAGISTSDLENIEGVSTKITTPFEKTALAKYYNQVLQRANISFWFSLIFASIGFGVIIFGFVTYEPDDLKGALIKTLSGAIIDAVSALFFVQSVNAQKSMTEFFEKLRLDRLNAEARELLGEIENIERRDQLRAQIILKYTGIDILVVGG